MAPYLIIDFSKRVEWVAGAGDTAQCRALGLNLQCGKRKRERDTDRQRETERGTEKENYFLEMMKRQYLVKSPEGLRMVSG